MYRYLAAIILFLASVYPVQAEECTAETYALRVSAAKAADQGKEWGRAVELYRSLLEECPSLIPSADLAKTYDALSVAQMMDENYSAAIETAKKCLELDGRYNSCMMTAALSHEKLGDRDMAISFAQAAVEVGGYDDYSAAVVILAKDFLKKEGKPLK